MTKRLAWFPVVILLAMLTACRAGNGLSVESAWSRPSPQGASNTAFYMTLVNDGDRPDVLWAVSAEVCETMELHRSFMDAEGVMRMGPVSDGEIVVPAGERVALEPGGLHMMCIGLQQPLLAGQQVPLMLEFDGAGSIAVVAEVRQDGS